MRSDPASTKLSITPLTFRKPRSATHLHSFTHPHTHTHTHTVKHILTLSSSHFALSDYVQNEQIELKLAIMALWWNNSSNNPIQLPFQTDNDVYNYNWKLSQNVIYAFILSSGMFFRRKCEWCLSVQKMLPWCCQGIIVWLPGCSEWLLDIWFLQEPSSLVKFSKMDYQ